MPDSSPGDWGGAGESKRASPTRAGSDTRITTPENCGDTSFRNRGSVQAGGIGLRPLIPGLLPVAVPGIRRVTGGHLPGIRNGVVLGVAVLRVTVLRIAVV